jgi:aspartyl-tRNA(Asn)/glutamyl-tRNA(Gln) amidotransferase subunit C
MNKITDAEMKHLAELSNLSLTEKEAAALQKDLTAILNYVEELNEVDVSGIEPTYQVFDMETIWRKDEEIDYAVTREQLLNLSQNIKNNSVVVPKVL